MKRSTKRIIRQRIGELQRNIEVYTAAAEAHAADLKTTQDNVAAMQAELDDLTADIGVDPAPDPAAGQTTDPTTNPTA